MKKRKEITNEEALAMLEKAERNAFLGLSVALTYLERTRKRNEDQRKKDMIPSEHEEEFQFIDWRERFAQAAVKGAGDRLCDISWKADAIRAQIAREQKGVIA